MLPRTIHRIQNLARQPIQQVTIKELLARSAHVSEQSHIQHAIWLQEQVPIRLAHRLAGFLELPYVVFCNTRFHEVFQLFHKSFQTLEEIKPIKTLDDANQFAETIRGAHREHGEVIGMLQEGYGELQALLDNIDLDVFLNKTLTTRVGNRMLTEHFLVLQDAFAKGTGECTGVVHPRCRPAQVIDELSRSLRNVFFDVYGIEPSVTVQGQMDTEFTFIYDHLHFMLQEILKNALRATIEMHMHTGQPVPPVTVEIMKGSFDVTLKVSDQGGGMRPQQLKEVWRYGSTTANNSVTEQAMSGGGVFSGLTASLDRRSIAGYGFGLPLSRLYAQYFGGDIVVQSMHGYGSDVYLNVNHLGDTLEARE